MVPTWPFKPGRTMAPLAIAVSVASKFSVLVAGILAAPRLDRRIQGQLALRGQQRGNATHQSRTDPEARLARKGKGREGWLSFMGHVLMENRNGLLWTSQLPRRPTRLSRISRRSSSTLLEARLPPVHARG